MTDAGDDDRMRATMSLTVFAPCTVAVGLFGLLKNTNPLPGAAAIMPSTSRRKLESTLTSFTCRFRRFEKFVGFSNVGTAVTRPLLSLVNARTAFLKISCDPAPNVTFSGLH